MTYSGLRKSLVTYIRPVVSILVAVPILLQTVVHSAAWVGTVFPGFFLMDNAVVPSVSGYDWPPDRTTLFHAQVRSIDGEPVRASADLYRRVAAQPAGTVFRYEFRKHGERVEREIASRRFGAGDFLQTYAVLLVFGLISLAAGIVVGFLQPATRQARVYHMQAVVVGLYAITGAALYQGGWTGLTVLYLVLESWVGATFMHLALRFPIERALTGWRRAVLAALYGLALVQTVFALRGFYADPPDLAAIQRNYLINAASFVFFLASLAYAYWEDRTPIARARVKALLPGIFFGTLLMFYAFVNNAREGGDFPMQFGILFVPVLYVSVAWAIARHDLFDIDRVVRQSFVYAALSAIVLAAYASLLSLVAWLFPGAAERDTSVITVGFVLLTALLIDPLRRSVQYLIDRAFFRTRLDYSATISALSDALTTQLDARAIVDQVIRVLLEAMHLERAALCIFEADGSGRLWIGEPDAPLATRPADAGLQRLTSDAGRAVRLWAVDALAEVSPPAAAVLHDLGAAACLPLVVSGRTVGVLLLGRRRSGKPFAADDAALLRTLAGQAAIALQNAVSFHALEELTRTLDERVRQQTDELRRSHAALEQAYDQLKNAQSQLVQSEKMASLGQLVAGVAHELNNPASFVSGAMDNLREFFTEYVAALSRYRTLVAEAGLDDRAAEELRGIDLDFLERETPELLAACSEGSDRIRRTVDDLRTFARVDRGGRVAVDVTAGIDSTLRLLQPRLAKLGVATECDYGAVAAVLASPGRLNQVWMNLLANAIDAMEDSAAPRLRISARDDGDEVVVAVQDNGRGIAPEIRARIFEPFFTTRAIGEGTGLGLSIAYGIVREIGGTIDVESVVGGGTTVRVRMSAMGKAPVEAGAEKS